MANILPRCQGLVPWSFTLAATKVHEAEEETIAPQRKLCFRQITHKFAGTTLPLMTMVHLSKADYSIQNEYRRAVLS